MRFKPVRPTPFRILALAAAVGLAGAAVGIVAAKDKPNDCRSVIAGTYHNPSGSLVSLTRDGTIVGTLSETSQVGAGQGDVFQGNWQCDGDAITGRDFRWVDNPAGRQISRVDWDATFDPADGGSIDAHYTFYRLDEDATAEEIADAAPLFTDDVELTRLAAP